MKFSAVSSVIADALSVVAPSVDSRPTRPILSNVKVTASVEDAAIEIVGMNDTMSIKTSFEALILEPGSVCIPHAQLSSLLGSFGGEYLDLYTEESMVNVINGKSRYKLSTMPSHDFPGYALDQSSEPFTFPAPDLFDGLRLAATTASNDQTKQVLCGVHIKTFEDGSIEFAATDGHRLTVFNAASQFIKQAHEFTLPKVAIKAMTNLLNRHNCAGDVTLNVGPTVVSATIGKTSMASRVLEGQYPHYRQLIPTTASMPFNALVPTKPMVTALKRVALLTSRNSDNGFIVKLSFSGNEVTISGDNKGISEATEVITLPETVSQEMTIGFNGVYLMEAINNAGTTNVRLLASTPVSPAMIYGEDSQEIEALIMPIQIRNV